MNTGQWILSLGIAAIVGDTPAGHRPAHESQPMLRGWLLETLRADTQGALDSYAAATDPHFETLALARTLELGAATDARDLEASAAYRRLAAHGVTNLDLTGLEAVARARRVLGPGGHQTPEATREARATLLEFERARDRASQSPLEIAFQRGRAGVVRPIDEREARRAWRAAIRRSWLLTVERLLAGQIEAAERIATHELGWRQDDAIEDPTEYVEQRLELFDAMLAAQPVGAIEHTMLRRVRERADDLVRRDAYADAADLLSRVPLFGR